MIRRFRTLIFPIFAVLALLASPVMASESDTELIRTISTTGVGVVTVEPDAATFSLGLEARNDDLKPAQDEVTGESNAITAYLIESGIEEKDIVTSGYQVEPVEKHDRNGNFVEIEGYVVRMIITVTVRDLDTVGELIDQGVSLGAEYVSSISFFVSDPSPHIQQARRAAIADAKLKAEDYAAGSDVTITGLYTLYESSSPNPTAEDADYERAAPSAAPMDAASAEVTNPVSVSAGSTTITVRVETVWTVEPNGTITPQATPSN